MSARVAQRLLPSWVNLADVSCNRTAILGLWMRGRFSPRWLARCGLRGSRLCSSETRPPRSRGLQSRRWTSISCSAGLPETSRS